MARRTEDQKQRTIAGLLAWRETAGSWNRGVPMRESTKQKLSTALKGRDLIPKGQRGGNGRGMSEAEKLLSEVLAPGWVWNYAIRTKGCTEPNIPPAYKPDFAWPIEKVCLEVDGISHKADRVKAADAKKTRVLEALGWRVLRISNAEVFRRYGT